MTGVFLASAAQAGLIRFKNISFSDDSRVGFASVFVMVLVLIINISLGYLVITRYASSVSGLQAAQVINETGNLEDGLAKAERALGLAKTDSNYRLLSQIHVARLNALLGREDLAGTEEGTAQFQAVLGEAISSAQSATQVDEEDDANWLALGNIYEALISLNIQGAYENARQTYQRAGSVGPTNPLVDLSLARLEVLRGDNESARIHINDSLVKKNNYTGAIFLLSQIEINEGNIAAATQAVEAASLIDPNDPLTFFQLGFLKYSQRDFEGSIQALERAVTLNPPYSNAKYFLGLSYYAVGRIEDAIVQFEDIEVLNPDNQDVKFNFRKPKGR